MVFSVLKSFAGKTVVGVPVFVVVVAALIAFPASSICSTGNAGDTQLVAPKSSDDPDATACSRPQNSRSDETKAVLVDEAISKFTTRRSSSRQQESRTGSRYYFLAERVRGDVAGSTFFTGMPTNAPICYPLRI